MNFLVALLLCILIPTWGFSKLLYSNGRPSASERRLSSRLAVMFSLIGTMGLSAGFISGVFQPAVWRSSDVNLTPWLFLFGGVVTGLSSLFIATRPVVQPDGGRSRRGGAWILCSIAGGYIGFTAIDHFKFFWDDKNSGIIASDIGRAAGISCEASYLLAHQEGKAIRYRCPLTIQLGSPFGQPFVPWPSYTEGTSEALAEQIEKIKREAIDVRASGQK
jgi:hypothetical protein